MLAAAALLLVLTIALMALRHRRARLSSHTHILRRIETSLTAASRPVAVPVFRTADAVKHHSHPRLVPLRPPED